MKIGIIGSGIVGQVLATAFIKEGHEVMLGTRNTSKPEVLNWLQSNPEGLIGLFEETANFADLIVLATGGSVTVDAVKLAGVHYFENKVVIDATNPIDVSVPPSNGVMHFFTSQNESLLEIIQAVLPNAYLVKAFNSVGNPVFYKPAYKEGKPTMFIAGNNDAAKLTVTAMLETFGYEAVDMGKAEAARPIEQLCKLWCIPGFIQNQWTHAFKLLKV